MHTLLPHGMMVLGDICSCRPTAAYERGYLSCLYSVPMVLCEGMLS